MASFEPTDEQQMLVEAVRKYAENDLRPAFREAEESRELPEKLVEKGWDLGVLQASIPESYGGFGGHSAVTSVLALEELAYGDLASALAVTVPSLFAIPVLLVGNDEQKKEYLSRVVEDNRHGFTSALIEYTFDFDANDLRTCAERINGEYVLKGEKSFVPFVQEAGTILVYAKCDGKTQGFIVPKDALGLSVNPEREKLMGLNALPLYRILLEDVRVPVSNRLGGPSGHDFEPILASMRIASASAALGVARAAFEYSRDYAKEREAFGVKIAQKQAVAFMLAEMCTEIEAIRLLTWEAAWRLDQGREDTFTSAYFASTGAADMVMMVTDRAVQILGGHGYIRENPVELWMRNGRGFAMLTGLAIV